MPTALALVTRPPATGKTSLARPLAAELGWPLLSKDVIKEALVDILGAGDRPWSQQLGVATYRIMWALARDMPAAVLESNFNNQAHEPLRELDARIVEVFCHVAADELLRRFRTRPRHEAHLDHVFSDDEVLAWADTRPLFLGPVLEVDTTSAVDIASIADWVRQALLA